MSGSSGARWAVFCLATLVAVFVTYRLSTRDNARSVVSPDPSRTAFQPPRNFVAFARAPFFLASTLVAVILIYGAYRHEIAAPSPAPAAPNEPAVAAAAQAPAPTPELTPAPTPTRAPLVLASGAPWSGPAYMPILMYHHVTNAPPASELDARLTVTDGDFARQLAYLRCAGYYSITLSQLFDGIYGGAPLPVKPVILTFDDGYADAYTSAFAHLKWAGFGGTFSVVTGWIGEPGYLSWDQTQEMVGAGMEMVAHSVSHPDLGKEPDEVVRSQLSRSKRDLEENLGQPVVFFVYPAGEPFRSATAERQSQVVTMVQEAGYRGALTATWNLAQDPAAPFALNRVRVSGGIDIKTFAENMGGPAPEAIGC
jgi:peptidoglycan/xylan/chitin deacetylase (PgdA/CDA1 family)